MSPLCDGRLRSCRSGNLRKHEKKPLLAHSSVFMSECRKLWKELSKQFYQNEDLFQNLFRRSHILTRISVQALFCHMAGISQQCDGRKEGMGRVDIFQQLCHYLQSISKHHGDCLHHNLSHMSQGHNNLEHPSMIFLFAVFDHWQCKSCRSLTQRLRRPNMNHKYFGLLPLQLISILAKITLSQNFKECPLELGFPFPEAYLHVQWAKECPLFSLCPTKSCR